MCRKEPSISARSGQTEVYARERFLGVHQGEEMKKNRIVVNGFAFTDRETAQKAVKEAESINYIREKLDMGNPRMVLEIYRKLTKEQVFQTPVGFVFLKQLQDYLARKPEFKMEGLEPIQTISAIRRPNPAQASSPRAGQAPAQPEGLAKQAGADASANGGQDASGEFGPEEMAEWYEGQIEGEKQKRRDAQQKQRRAESKLKGRQGMLRFSVAVNLFLLIVAIGMAVITFMDNSPNIINYENKIIDKYAEWEQGLKEREKSIKQREHELGL